MKTPVNSIKKIRLFLIEDNRLLREGIISVINEHDDLFVKTARGTNGTIFRRIESYKPAIILIDLGLRNQNSLSLVKTIKKKYPDIHIIVMDLILMQEDIFEFVQAGVSGFILKDATTNEFVKTIRRVSNGEKVLPSTLADSLFSQIVKKAITGPIDGSSHNLLDAVRMTRRELQVISFIAEGITNKEIAKKLHISPYTVKSHVHNLLEKLALHSRVQIARYAHTSKEMKDTMNSISLLDE
jgi:DNA-binding NarL/FixJ family response regulator